MGEPVLPYQGDHNAANAQNGYLGRLEVIIMDSEDGRPLLSKVARRIAEDRKSRALNYELLLEYIQKGARPSSGAQNSVFPALTS